MAERKKYAVMTMDVESFSDCDCFKRTKVDLDFDMFDGMENFIEILDRNGVQSTLFVVSNTLHALHGKLSEYAKNGHHIALHGFDHTPPCSKTDDEFRRMTLWAKEHIEDACGVSISGYRAPYFGLDRSKLEILRELGFMYDSSQLDFPLAEKNFSLDLADFKRLNRLTYEKAGFYEFKIGCHEFFGHKYPISGGAYLRLCVWDMMKHFLRQHLAENDLYIFYAHPFEMSKKKLPAFRHMSLTDRMYLNVGRMNYCKRLDEIIQMLISQGYEFVTMEALVSKYKSQNNASDIKICTE